MIKTCQLWDPALSICSLRIMWLIWENDWDHIGEYQSPHLKGALNCNFIKKSTQTNAAVGSLQTLPDKINGPSGVKGERSRPLSEAFPCTQCVILKKVGTGWFNLDHEEKAFFFSFPNACALGFIIDYPCWAIWGKHLSHLKTCHGIKSG